MISVHGLRHALAAVLAAMLLVACNQSEQTEVSPELNRRVETRNQLRKQLTGTWARRVRANETLWEGLRLDPDGRLGLFGVHTLHGLQWLVRGDTLVLTTSTEKYARPEESRLWVQRADDDSLVLSAERGYLAGSYERHPGFARRVTGTVNARSMPQLTADAALYLELRAVTGQEEGKFLASQTLPVGMLHGPIPFHVYYAVSDAQGFDVGFMLVTLVIDGVPLLNLETGFRVDLTADAEGLEVWLGEPAS